MAGKTEKPKRPPIPWWAWVFAVACGAIPVLTLGGALPGAIGFGGAGACVTLARNRELPVVVRVAFCTAITAACYTAVIAIGNGVALLTR